MTDIAPQLYNMPIEPLILRHVQDAAWYWSQWEGDRLSPVVDAASVQHYQKLLRCHLEGLSNAPTMAWAFACKELQRWKDPEQLFVCWWLALQDPDPEKTTHLWPFLGNIARAENAVAAALVLSEPQHRTPWLETWLHSPIPQARRMAISASAALGQTPELPLEPLFFEDHLTVAAVCTLAGVLRRTDLTDHLHLAATSPHAQVCEAAAVALLACGHGTKAAPLLAQAMLRHHALMECGESSSALEEEHNAQVLACLYGHALPMGSMPEQLAEISALPPYLIPHICAHHGDAAALPLLSTLLGQPDSAQAPHAPHSPQMLRAICRLTGLAAEDDGLCLPAVHPDDEQSEIQFPSPPDYPGHGLESGLPAPDVQKVRTWLADMGKAIPTGVPLLQGKIITLAHCLAVLEADMQDNRFAAAWHALRLCPGALVDVTAPWALQQMLFRELHNYCHQE